MIEALVASKLQRTQDGGHGCTDCQYTSKHLNCVKIHIESKHLNTGGFDCPECGKNVPTRNALKVHRQRNHSLPSVYMTIWWNKRPLLSNNFLSDDAGEAAVWSQIGKLDDGSWTCLVCAYSTHHKTNMFQHVEARHVQTEGYHCLLCQKFCPNSKSLKNHKSRCPNKSPRIIVWDIALSRPNHQMLMPLLALICCISATIAQSLQDREFADNLIRSKLEMNSVSRLWFCKECPYSHARHDVMKKHVDAQHLAIQYSCSICLKLSPTQHALKQHQSSQHK